MGLFGKSKKAKEGTGGDDPGNADSPSSVFYAPASAAASATAAAAATGNASEPATSGSEENITRAITDCFAHHTGYLRVQTSILLSCTTPTSLHHQCTAESSIVYSSACYHDLDDPTSARDTLQPHIYELTADAYSHMRRLHQDQTIVLSGVSGSGKPESARLIVDQLGVLASNAGRHVTRAQHQSAHLVTLIDAFASTQTPHSSMGATRAAVWHEVQFSERGHVAGNKLVAFGLDRFRVTDRLAGDHGAFNVFYYLLQGATSAERQEWQLRGTGYDGRTPEYAYLRSGNGTSERMNDDGAYMMDQVRAALSACCGVKASAVVRVLAGILHLGNIEFIDDTGEETAGIRNPEAVSLAALCLGVPTAALTATLLYRTSLVGSDLCTVFLNSHGAAAQRDALARALYHVLFYWIIDAANHRLSDPRAANHIAVFHMYGFTGEGSSSDFERFAVNLANERLAAFVLRDSSDSGTIARQMHEDSAGGSGGHRSFYSPPALHLLDGLVSCLEMHATGAAPLDDIALINTISRMHGDHPSYY
ncbi:hypothetical protein GGI21_003793, partial [Coemansia aciculifera]